MNHLVTRRVGGGIEMLYQAPEMDNAAITMPFGRVSIGMIFPQQSDRAHALSYAYACAVGERSRDSGDSNRDPEKSYIVIDEVEGTAAKEYYDDLSELKDRYMAETVFCPKTPPSSVDMLRRTEGLAYYADDNSHDLRARFPTFVSKDNVASIYPVEVPEFSLIQQQIGDVLRAELLAPVTRWPVMTKGAKVVRRLMFPANLPTRKLREGMESSNVHRMTALWLAVHGLENTSVRMDDGENTISTHRPGRTGY